MVASCSLVNMSRWEGVRVSAASLLPCPNAEAAPSTMLLPGRWVEGGVSDACVGGFLRNRNKHPKIPSIKDTCMYFTCAKPA